MNVIQDTDSPVKEKPLTQPTKEEVTSWYQEQIAMAKLRLELAELLSKTAQEDAKRTQALAIIAQLQAAPKSQDSKSNDPGIDHIVTQEDLDNNPELVNHGIKVGDAITLENQVEPTPES